VAGRYPGMSTSRNALRPGQAAPDLELPLVGGGSFRLADRRPRRFTMLVFNRGLHCPVCQAQLRELDRRHAELAERGIEVVSVSAEDQHRATRMRDNWRISAIPIAHGLTEEQMRAWGLFVSRAIHENEPPVFNEPALFLLRPDRTVFYASVLSMPVGRPRLDDLRAGIDYWDAHEYPLRGDA
jgi:peroxiredoxin